MAHCTAHGAISGSLMYQFGLLIPNLTLTGALFKVYKSGSQVFLQIFYIKIKVFVVMIAQICLCLFLLFCYFKYTKLCPVISIF